VDPPPGEWAINRGSAVDPPGGWAINRGSTVDPPGEWAPSVASADSVADPYIA
jgi:hypothetical protein